MLMYAMSVSRDGLIADRERAFGWSAALRRHTAEIGYLAVAARPGEPSFKAAMQLMRKHDPQSDGGRLQRDLASGSGEVAAEFDEEPDPGLRRRLLELIGRSRFPGRTPEPRRASQRS
jgi:hypothetical protein